MPHIFFIIAVMFGLIYGVFKFFVYIIDSFVLIDETFISSVKNKNSTFLDFFLLEEADESLEEKTRIKLKRVNMALRLDFLVSSILGILWFFFPFILLQLTETQIAQKSPQDKYIGKWLALILLFSNAISLKYLKNGKIFSKQFVLLTKLMCACIILITTLIILINTKKMYISTLINIIITSIWLSNNAVGLFISYKK
tara:strand:+ start:283 stop:876 length:594 start_codon:yes stop_codon:yes gene_type:complete